MSRLNGVRRLRLMLSIATAMPLALLVAGSVHAQTYTVLHNFTGGATDGANPQGPLIEDSKHLIYGATGNGGKYGYGTVFKMNKAGKTSLLNSFDYIDGQNPTNGVIQGPNGTLYGTAMYGGDGEDYQYSGALFELNKKKEIELYSFPDGGSAPADPNGVIADAQGNLYGVATQGGADYSGFIYEYDTAGNMSVLYTFTGGTDGYTPQGPLAWGPDGDLYGVTQSGGANGVGTVFKMDTSGNLTTLYSFVYGGTDGYYPNPGSLAFDAEGNIYGTTLYGGSGTACSRHCGTVFEVTPTGSESILYSFQGGTGGGYPQTGVVLDSAGTIYGTTTNYGDQTCSCGVLFSLNSAGNETVLHTWTGSDGSGPSGQLLLSGGSLYGFTGGGGTSNDGVAFRWSAK
jgi:uncharacterized repeat protein (TIGR03803 family)